MTDNGTYEGVTGRHLLEGVDLGVVLRLPGGQRQVLLRCLLFHPHTENLHTRGRKH